MPTESDCRHSSVAAAHDVRQAKARSDHIAVRAISAMPVRSPSRWRAAPTSARRFQRWTARRKVELLLQLIKGEVKLVDACREHDLKQSDVESWMETFVKAGERGLKARSEDEQTAHDREVRELRRA
jgi:hypothetical protein